MNRFTHKAHRCALLGLALTLALLLTCCSGLHNITVSGDTYTDSRTDTSYLPLSISYAATPAEEYAKMKLAGVTSLFYTIEGLDPLEYLCDEFGGIYCADGVTVPAFADWTVDRVQVYARNATEKTVPLINHTTQESELAALLHDAYVNGTRAELVSYLEVEASYVLRFTDNDIPGLYYTFTYREYAENVTQEIDGVEVDLGRYFIYDRHNDIFVAVDSTLHQLLRAQQTVQ